MVVARELEACGLRLWSTRHTCSLHHVIAGGPSTSCRQLCRCCMYTSIAC
jgi:hypothetical protein